MSLYRGTRAIKAVYRGARAVTRVYRGTRLVFDSGGSGVKTTAVVRMSTLSDNVYKCDLYFWQSENEGVLVDWGDGTSEYINGVIDAIDPDGYAAHAYHEYAAAGDYHVDLRPIDGVVWSPGASLVIVNTSNEEQTNTYGFSGQTSIKEAILNDYLIEFNFTSGSVLRHNKALYGCSALTSITIPNDTTEIPAGAFMFCVNAVFNVPENVMRINANAFNRCASLNWSALPTGITFIGANAFEGCGLKISSIPSSVVEVGENAFKSCTGITELELAAAYVGVSAFNGCANMERVWIRNTCVSIPETVSTDSTTGAINGYTSAFSGSFRGCVLYAEAAAKLPGWGEYFALYSAVKTNNVWTFTNLPVIWNQATRPTVDLNAIWDATNRDLSYEETCQDAVGYSYNDSSHVLTTY